MEEAENSLTGYESQLTQVQAALLADPDNSELAQLKNDLDQVILLTSQSLLELKKQQLLDSLEESSASKGEEETVASSASNTNTEDDSTDSDLKKLVGMKCRVPHRARGCGTSSVNNAVVFDVEKSDGGGGSHEQPRVRVVFSHPLTPDMAPCPFYLDGRCRFDADECRYSHGHSVALSDLQEFVEPDFSSLTCGSVVLARDESEKGPAQKKVTLWKRATVLETLGETVKVHFSQSSKDFVTLPLDSVFPLDEASTHDDGDDHSTEFDDVSRIQLEQTEDNFVPAEVIGNLSTESLGDWEKHTRGVGSRLMAKMGYVTGSGLGKKGEGRVAPVPATVYPTGKSLDWCMEAREKAGGGDVLTAERMLAREKEREERRSRKRAAEMEARDRRENKLFDFINKSVAKTSVAPRQSTSKGDNDDKGGLNVKSLRLAEDIRGLEKEVSRLESAHARHRGRDPAAAAAIAAKLKSKRERLAQLRRAEGSLAAKRDMERGNKKLAIF